MSARRNLALGAAIILVVALLFSLNRRQPTELAFLAVGQGDCALFQTSGKTVMIDTGPASGARIVIDELRRRGVKRLDMVLLSHPDADHIAALPQISKRVKIVRVVVPAYFQDHPDLQLAFKESGVQPNQIAWLAGPSEARIGAFHMYMDVPPWVDGMPDNDGSMMVRIASGNASVTFTGDAGFEEEIQMMKKGTWSAQILKLGHHGSKFSTGDSWLDHVHPELAIVSCGRDNSYGHPTDEVLSKCAQKGVQVFRTDRQGSLTFRLSGGKWVKH